MMCISIGTYFASKDRFAASGVAFGFALLVRPHTAAIAACIGLTVAFARRSVRPALEMGVTSALGLVALLWYNNVVFGSPSISGGYGGVFAERLIEESPWVVIERLIGALIHGRVGILWSSPIVGLAMVALVLCVRKLPAWAIGGAIGGFVYMVIQLRANRVTGGSGFFSYRYPLEALMVAAPALVFSVWQWAKNSDSRQRLVIVLAALSVLAHGFGALMPTNL